MPSHPRPAGDKQLVVAGIIAGPDSRVLATRRTRPASLAGLWEFPGGKVEPGEGRAEALVREIDEELRLPIRVGAAVPPPAGIATAEGFWPISEALEMAVLRAVAETLQVTLSPAHDDHRWCTTADLAALDWVPADRPVVEALQLADTVDYCAVDSS